MFRWRHGFSRRWKLRSVAGVLLLVTGVLILFFSLPWVWLTIAGASLAWLGWWLLMNPR